MSIEETWELATNKLHVSRGLFVELLLPGGAVRVHDGIGWLQWGDYGWGGVGSLGAISGISGGVDGAAAEMSLIISGIPTTERENVLTELARGSEANVYQGVLNESAGTWDFEPELVFAGFIDAPEIQESVSEDGGAFLTITVPVLDAASFMRRIQIWRRTDADQRTLYPGDKFFEFKTDLNIPIPAPMGGGPVLPGYGFGGVAGGFTVRDEQF